MGHSNSSDRTVRQRRFSGGERVRTAGDLGEEIPDKWARAETWWLVGGPQWRRGPLVATQRVRAGRMGFMTWIGPGLAVGLAHEEEKEFVFTHAFSYNT
jgi:hypothetical protein